MTLQRSPLALIMIALPLFFTGVSAAERPVADAAERGDIETVRQLLRKGADVNTAQGDGMTALHWAADRDNVELGEVLIYAGASVDAGTRIGRYTPLHIASRKGNTGIMNILLKAKSNPNAATTNSGVTAIHLAAASGNPEVVTTLLEFGADVNALETSWGQTPLIFAAANGRVEVLKVLLEAGADPAITARSKNVVEQEEADRAAEKRLTEILAGFKEKEGGGTDWQPSPSQVQAAIQASWEIQRRWPDVPHPDDDEIQKTDKTKKVSRRKRTTKSDNELKSANKDKKQSVKKTSSRNAGANTTSNTSVIYNADGNPVYDDKEIGKKKSGDKTKKPATYGELVDKWGGLTPLLHAVRQGHIDASLILLDGGADINQASAGDQTTPLFMATINGHFDLALILLERGADPNLASTAGTTPLFAVLERTWAPRASYAHPTEHQQQNASHLHVMEALLQAGADPNVRLKKHLWYMEYTFSVLRQAGIYLEGATPFWRAAHALDVNAMRLLKQYGAEPNVPTIKPAEKKPDCKKEPDKCKKSIGSAFKRFFSSLKGNKPVPPGGPFIYPIHAASGAGYGQWFAGNAHRYVLGNWLPAVKFLVEECDADVNIRDANGYTALHHAASRGDNELVSYLVEKGAKVNVVSRKGETTADMANGPIERVPPYPETISLLEKLGSKNNNHCVSC